MQGTRPYRVKLWLQDGELEYSCTCPVGNDGAFCKHCVAVGLAWLAQGEVEKAPGRKRSKPAVTMDDVRAYLAGQDKNVLADMLMEQAMDDDRLRQRLLMKAAKRSAKGVDIAAYRQVIDGAVDPGGFVDYRNAHDYARGIEEAIDSVEELLKEGHAPEVVELTEHALGAVEDAMGTVDDSDGYVGGILERLQELHHKACKQARTQPEDLAKRLFQWELRTAYDTFFGAAATYADILGAKGLAVYRKLAEAEWAKVPALGPGRDDPNKYGRRFRITHIMETLARESGDVEALVAIKSRDLSAPYAYLQIAEVYKQARKHDKALEWAERGVKAFPERTDSRLRLFLADEYHRRDRHDEAMALIWAEFSGAPSLEQYRNLKVHAGQVGQWQAWREKALGFVRETIAKAKRENRKDRWGWSRRTDHRELVSIFLWEKDVDAAWREAQEGGCSNSLWMELAARREKDHPEDALPVYQNQVEPTVNQKNNEAYREAIGLLRKVRGLMVRLGRESDFGPYLESVRAAHRPKRNFMKLLDRAKWS
ncbi:MAG: SWIM zinc finger family protein [Acidobacteria bacterium]|nr:SWIM zinc finger family protein [Acidobacteriota bacterium]